MNNCFLCSPNEKLVYHREDTFFTMVGLGPIVEGYSIVSSIQHYASCSDSFNIEKFYKYFEKIRKRLEAHYSSCLITEHGKMPVCIGKNASFGGGEHCYHGHLLLYPAVSDIHALIERNFNYISYFHDYISCAESAIEQNEYFFYSPDSSDYRLYLEPKREIQQFSRLCVTLKLNLGDLWDWQKYPNEREAFRLSKQLRKLFTNENENS